MKEQQKTSPPRFFLYIALGIGIVLSAFSIASGNNPIIQPDLSTYTDKLIQNQVPADQLSEWIIDGKQDFRVAGFRSKSECKEQKKVTKVLKCHNAEKLESPYWIRKQFKNLNMPLIVYGNNSEDGVQAASILAYHGYNARVLKGGFNDFEKRFLQPEFGEIDTVDANDDQLKKLSVYRYFTGDDQMVKTPGQKWVVAMADSDTEEEEEGEEEGEDEDDDEDEDDEEEDDDDDEEEEEEEEEGC